jgi:hypothetical protein
VKPPAISISHSTVRSENRRPSFTKLPIIYSPKPELAYEGTAQGTAAL